jgi:hypothetical protein
MDEVDAVAVWVLVLERWVTGKVLEPPVDPGWLT